MPESTGHTWLIEPVAPLFDGWWQGRPVWRLAVRAPNAALARALAENWARRNHTAQGRKIRNAGFEDERLYRVREASAEEDAALQFPAGPILEIGEPVSSTGPA